MRYYHLLRRRSEESILPWIVPESFEELIFAAPSNPRLPARSLFTKEFVLSSRSNVDESIISFSSGFFLSDSGSALSSGKPW